MTIEHLKHPAILSYLFKMADDNDLTGASEFLKGKFVVLNAVSLLLWVVGGGNLFKTSLQQRKWSGTLFPLQPVLLYVM